MQFLLKYGDIESFLLPVTPAEFTIQAGQQNQSVQVLKLGELNLWGPEKLDGISVQSFFPVDKNAPYVQKKTSPDPWDCVALINRWRRSGKTIRIIITDARLKVNINMECLIESFEYGIKDGSGDVNYTMVLKQYKRVQIPKSDAPDAPVLTRSVPESKQSSSSGSKTPSGSTAKKTYTVKSGDKLWSIAKAQYGSGSLWQKLYEANKSTIKDPNVISPGLVITIP